MSRLLCNICRNTLNSVLYKSAGNQSLTSLCQIFPGSTQVYSCKTCGHLQTAEIDNAAAYYDSEYDILVNSEEEDQIYEVANGKPIYRTEHQVTVLLSKLSIPPNAALLDYGCAKSSTIRTLVTQRTDIVPHLFDISSRYIPFWEKFISPSNWSINEISPAWNERFDVVTSFFSLEHMVHPENSLRQISRLIKSGGKFYCIVPNVLSNIADFIVIDHVNHFSETSISYLLSICGFKIIEIDDQAHRGAFVIVAERNPDSTKQEPHHQEREVAQILSEFDKLAAFWHQASEHIQSFEKSNSTEQKIAVYGAGFYGAFIATNLKHPERIACHLDQNSFLQGRLLNGAPIVAPTNLPLDINTVMVGLNPTQARNIISNTGALAGRNINYFYL